MKHTIRRRQNDDKESSQHNDEALRNMKQYKWESIHKKKMKQYKEDEVRQRGRLPLKTAVGAQRHTKRACPKNAPFPGTATAGLHSTHPKIVHTPHIYYLCAVLGPACLGGEAPDPLGGDALLPLDAHRGWLGKASPPHPAVVSKASVWLWKRRLFRLVSCTSRFIKGQKGDPEFF